MIVALMRHYFTLIWSGGQYDKLKPNNTIPQTDAILCYLMKRQIRKIYFFLCLFFLKRFLRLWVDILCLFLFFPLGIVISFRGFVNYLVLFLTSFTKVLAGLKAGILCAGIIMVVFFEIFLPVFSALLLMVKLPNPLR